MYQRTIPIFFNAGLLFLEAVITSAYVRFSLSFLSYQIIRKWQGEPVLKEVERVNLDREQRIIVRKVSNALRRCNKYTPWKTECYTQALTAKILLKRRKINSFLYIGFMKPTQKTEGHAWLIAGHLFVVGNHVDLNSYSVNGIFL